VPLNCVSVLVSEEKDLMSSGDARFSLLKGSLLLLPLLVKCVADCPSGVEEMLLNAEGNEVSVCGWE
jgi:hypothetical protein